LSLLVEPWLKPKSAKLAKASFVCQRKKRRSRAMTLMRPAPPREIESLLRDGYSIGIGDRFNEAMEIFKPNMWPLIGLGAVFFVGSAIFARIPIIGSLVVSFILAPLFTGAILRFAFEALRGKKPTFNDFIAIGDQAVPVIIGGAITNVFEVVGMLARVLPLILVVLVRVLCAILGLILHVIACFALPLIVDRRMDPIEAIKASIKVTMKNLGEVILAMLAAFGMALVGAVACLVGMIVTVPFAIVFLACVYAHVFGLTGAPEGDGNLGGDAGAL
jgi:hypothetical protein